MTASEKRLAICKLLMAGALSIEEARRRRAEIPHLDQFERAKKECEDPAKLGAWIPMLSQYGPDLLVKCENASDMSHKLVQGWLEANMFKADRDRRRKANKNCELAF